MSANLGWLFYKDYFDGVTYANIESDTTKKANETHVKAKVDALIEPEIDIENRVEEETLGNAHFKATTTYPGLLLGTGNGHELPSVKGQAILGFHFDYTTGLPEITGSSIKGVLRSAFDVDDSYGYIAALLVKMGLNTIDIAKLETEIFGQTNGVSKTQQGKDIFFDAYITHVQTTVLGDDYLAPHGDNPLQEPNVLRFIKVMPEVTFMFDFGLSDGELSASQKRKLFMYIIEDLGLGAKTNVGYGYFDNMSIFMSEFEAKEEKEKALKKLYDDALESKDIEKAKSFKTDYPNYHGIEKIDTKIESFKNEMHRKNLKDAWDRLDKNNKKFIATYVNKHKNDPLSVDIIEEAQKLLDALDQPESIAFEVLLKCDSLKDIQTKLQNYANKMTEDEIQELLVHIKSNDCTMNLKRKKFSFSLFKRILGDVNGQTIGDLLK